jgi:hypothetical protein
MIDHVEDVHLKYEPANERIIYRYPVQYVNLRGWFSIT